MGQLSTADSNACIERAQLCTGSCLSAVDAMGRKKNLKSPDRVWAAAVMKRRPRGGPSIRIIYLPKSLIVQSTRILRGEVLL